jgi:ribosome biogenesis GTPase
LGTVVAAYGKRYQVELHQPASSEHSEKTRISCVTRGKKTDLACGDIVTIHFATQNLALPQQCFQK